VERYASILCNVRKFKEAECNMSKTVNVINVRKRASVDIDEKVRQLNVIQQQKTELVKKEDELKKEINAHVDKVIQPDSNGHRFFIVTGYDGSQLIFEREARKSIKLNEERARELLAKKKLLKQAIRTIEVLDEEAINGFVVSNLLTLDELKSITDINVTYASKFVKRIKAEDSED
jgi:hypothetical protein